ncbi:hypothetical protein GCM10027267_32520 [Paramicrobacterium agarici]
MKAASGKPATWNWSARLEELRELRRHARLSPERRRLEYDGARQCCREDDSARSGGARCLRKGSQPFTGIGEMVEGAKKQSCVEFVIGERQVTGIADLRCNRVN